MQGIPEVPEVDDVNVSQETLRVHWEAFKFQSAADVDHYAGLLASGFELISQELEALIKYLSIRSSSLATPKSRRRRRTDLHGRSRHPRLIAHLGCRSLRSG